MTTEDEHHIRNYSAIGGKSHLERDPDYFRKLGKRGAAKFRERMQDEDFRAEFIRRARLGKEFGVKL